MSTRTIVTAPDSSKWKGRRKGKDCAASDDRWPRRTRSIGCVLGCRRSAVPEKGGTSWPASIRLLALFALLVGLAGGARGRRPRQLPATSEGARMARNRTLSRRSFRGRGGHSAGPRDLLHGRDGRRCLEDGKRRCVWENVSDGFFGGSVGAVAVSEWDPNVVYVGLGEKTIRGNVSPGDGLWKSTDAGDTWTKLGLADSQHISRIRIHPKNPDLSTSLPWGICSGPTRRGEFIAASDGGETFEQVLFVNEHSGAVDLAMDPTNPRVLYASLWRVRRTPTASRAAARAPALWKSVDGGDSWDIAERQRRLPARRSASSALPSPRPTTTTSTRSSRRRKAACCVPATAAKPGRASARTAICASAPGTTRASTRTRPTRRACTS